jgi:hypothetical protein
MLSGNFFNNPFVVEIRGFYPQFGTNSLDVRLAIRVPVDNLGFDLAVYKLVF